MPLHLEEIGGPTSARGAASLAPDEVLEAARREASTRSRPPRDVIRQPRAPSCATPTPRTVLAPGGATFDTP